MKYELGLNSELAANKKLSNGYTAYDWTVRQVGFPRFWIRDILGKNKITEQEIDFLMERDCSIAFAIRNLSQAVVSSNNGCNEAMMCVNAINSICASSTRILVFADIKEEWTINHNWMISFAKFIYDAGYMPGFIGNTDSSKNFNYDRQCNHFIDATKNFKNYLSSFFAKEPKTGVNIDSWSPYCPSAIKPSEIDFWESGTINMSNEKVGVVYLNNKKLLNCML